MNWLKLSALVGALVWAAPLAHAAEYPVRPIKLIVPYAAGGPTDVLGRMVGEYLARDLKQAVVVEKKGGAQGAIGAEAAARAEPDGYTLFFTAASIFVLNPLLYKKLPYDPAKDFRMLALITDLPVVMEVHPSVPAKTIQEFVAYAKQNPGKLNFGSAGTGGTIHLAGEMFKQMAGIDMVHVAYKGAGPALTDLLSGNIQVMFDTLGTALPPVKGGLLRPLAVSSAQRIPDLPDVPTVAESGYPDYVVGVWFGIAAPSKLPDDIAQKLTASLHKALGDDTFRTSLEKVGYLPLRPKTQAEIDKFVATDRARWAGVIKALNISLD
ncbi:tripartite tricarboxylate transporter substrate binding protein [Bradyrhizobium sp. 190]|uniref:Bug family tripartite tricarboxylate transporter substrate binding protein n=1 Tax=Bradyrhizobium sp. 190 TaxID=2782658 RepID=UPI001FFA76BA|nr:tripartite tricarboxylate transporter substrate binding protein [Bradyrhizobium sp. 190]MCK1514374.1 tripartite tricarboxylate transporter substrate binding protein [Bradyrhizobium sp. 190]